MATKSEYRTNLVGLLGLLGSAALGALLTYWALRGDPASTAYKFVFDAKLTDWFQALGTMAAVLIALMAYQNWREQEHAKRRADAAEKLLQAAIDTARAVRDARHVHVMPFPPPLSDRMLELVVNLATNSPTREELERSASSASALQAAMATAKIYFGEEAHKAALNVFSIRELVRLASNELELWKKDRKEPLAGVDQNVTMMHVNLMGLYVEADKVKDGKDKFANSLDQSVSELERTLSSHLTYAAK